MFMVLDGDGCGPVVGEGCSCAAPIRCRSRFSLSTSSPSALWLLMAQRWLSRIMLPARRRSSSRPTRLTPSVGGLLNWLKPRPGTGNGADEAALPLADAANVGYARLSPPLML